MVHSRPGDDIAKYAMNFVDQQGANFNVILGYGLKLLLAMFSCVFESLISIIQFVEVFYVSGHVSLILCKRRGTSRGYM